MHTKLATFLLLALTALPLAADAGEWTLEDMVRRNADGEPVYVPKPVPDALHNPYPETLERGFQERARFTIRDQSSDGVTGANTYFENEKRCYGYIMAQILGGHADKALRNL